MSREKTTERRTGTVVLVGCMEVDYVICLTQSQCDTPMQCFLRKYSWLMSIKVLRSHLEVRPNLIQCNNWKSSFEFNWVNFSII